MPPPLPNAPGEPPADDIAPAAPAGDTVEIHLVVPRAQLQQVQDIIGMINDAVQQAGGKADSDIAAQNQTPEQQAGLEGFTEMLNRA